MWLFTEKRQYKKKKGDKKEKKKKKTNFEASPDSLPMNSFPCLAKNNPDLQTSAVQFSVNRLQGHIDFATIV